MHFFEVGKTREKQNVQSKNNDKKSIDEQIEEINKEITELRESIDFTLSPQEFAEIQQKIEQLQKKRYLLLASKNRN